MAKGVSRAKRNTKCALSGIRKCNVGAKSCAQWHEKFKEKPDANKRGLALTEQDPTQSILQLKKELKQRTIATTQITGVLVRGGQGPSHASSGTWQYQSCGSGLPPWLEKPLRPGMWQGSPRVGAVTEKPGLYWRPQDDGDARTMGYLPRRAADQVGSQPKREKCATVIEAGKSRDPKSCPRSLTPE